MNTPLGEIASRFRVPGPLLSVAPHPGGHINHSFLAAFGAADAAERFLLQRINTEVFRQPESVMENIERVAQHIRVRLAERGTPDLSRRSLTLTLAADGRSYCEDDGGGYWRMYRFIERSSARDRVDVPEHAEAAGRAFGAFGALLADWPGPRLHETIPDFHNTPLRYDALDRAITADSHGRVAESQAEIDFALAHRSRASTLIDLLASGAIPERIVHNDAKISNVLFDNVTGDGLCVVDLDTVMPGLALFDFGDMMRSSISRGAEDDTALDTVSVEMPLFEGLARGYVATTSSFLTSTEKTHLVDAGLVITLEQGVRFLTDFLDGDRYYRIARPRQNLDRCRAQFQLVKSMLAHEGAMRRVVEVSGSR